MNILFICHEYPPATLVGGIGIFVKNISEHFVSIGHKVIVIGLYNIVTDTEEFLNGVRVVRVASKPHPLKIGWFIHRRRMFKKLIELHREINIDIIETSDYDAGLWLMPKVQIPRVVRLNGGEVYFRTLLRERLRRKHRIREKASIKKADAIASVSQYTWKETKYIFGLAHQEVPIFPNPVDSNRFAPSENSIVIGRILYSGTFIRKKGVLDLFQSLPSVFDNFDEAHLVCVGSDSKDLKTNSQSTFEFALSTIDPKYHDRITFVGKVSHDKILTYLNTANVCVFPSYLEAFPNAWIEAMACGKAVVASNTGSGPEVIQDGFTGLLCDPSDHFKLSTLIRNVLENPALANALGQAAREYVVNNLDIKLLGELNVKWFNSVIHSFKKV